MKNTRILNILGGALLLGALPIIQPAQAEIQWLDNIVAVAGKQVITQTELNQERRMVEHQLRSRKTQVPPNSALDRQVMERLIVKKLQLQAATRVGIRIDDETLERAVAKIADENGMGMSDFRRAIRDEGLGYSEFRNNIRDELAINSLRERQIKKRVNITEQEIDDFIEANVGAAANTEYSLSHILVSIPGAASPEQIEKSKAEISKIRARALEGADFSQLAITHSDGQKALEGGNLGWRKTAELPSIFSAEVKKLKTGEISNPIRSPSGFHLVKLNDSKGSAAGPKTTESKARHILIKGDDAQKTLKRLRAKIKAGEDFATLAKQHSADVGSGKQGGDLGWTFPGTFVPEFEATLEQLKVGEISQPFASQFGWHILQLMDQRTATIPQEMLRQRAKQLLSQQKQEEELQLWLRRLRDEAFVEYRLPGMDPADES